MRYPLAILSLVCALVVFSMPPVVHAALDRSATGAHLHRHHQGVCVPYGYSIGRCVIVPARGVFHVTVGGESVVLAGLGNPEDAGTEIITAPVRDPCGHDRANAFKLFADGPFPPLRLISPGRLYHYEPRTGSCRRIGYVTRSGLYAVAGFRR